MRPIRAIALMTFVLLASMSSATAANLWDVVTDPVGIVRGSSTLAASLERTLAQLTALEGRIDYDVQQRLEQIRSILNDTIENAEKAMLALERQINADAIRLLYRAKCFTEVALMDQFQRSFSQLIANIKKANPAISILGIRIINLDVGEIKIDFPDQAYISTKEALIGALREKKNNDFSAYTILSTYQNLERAASFTRCHYIDQALDTRWVQEVNELERLSLPWIQVVEPSMERQ